MIFNDIPSLFGLTFSLLIVVKSHMRQLPASWIAPLSLIPVAMGWQVCGVYVVWLLSDLTAQVAKKGPVGRKPMAILRRPSFIATGCALGGAILILGGQLLNEWRIVGGTLTTLPTVKSALWRMGAGPPESYAQYQQILKWASFFPQQALRIVTIITPFAGIVKYDASSDIAVFICFVVIGLMVPALRLLRERGICYCIPITFLFSGFLWAIPMKYFVAFHDFQSLYYIGIALALHLVLVMCISRRARRIAACIAMLLFVLSVHRMNAEQAQVCQIVNPVTAEFQDIYDKLPPNSYVAVDGDSTRMGIGFHAVHFYLSGSFFVPLEQAEYIVSEDPSYSQEKLTNNANVNLFRAVSSQ
jgi:hypothetical protein